MNTKLIIFISIVLLVVITCISCKDRESKKINLNNTNDLKEIHVKDNIWVTFENLDKDALLGTPEGAMLLADKNVLIWGDKTAIYDPDEKKFKVHDQGSTYDPILLSDNKYLFAPYTDNSFIFDAETKSFSCLAKEKTDKRINDFKDFQNKCKYKDEEKRKVLSLGKNKFLYAAECKDNTKTNYAGCSVIWLENHSNLKRYKYGKLDIERDNFDALMLKKGKVLIIGGGFVNEKNDLLGVSKLELYDPKTGEVMVVGSMKRARAKPKSIMLKDGRILITGGILRKNIKTSYSEQRCLNSAEIFDPQTEKSILTSFSTDPFGVCTDDYDLVMLKDGKVLLYGAAAAIFDPETNDFESIPKIKTYRSGHELIALNDDQVLVISGKPYKVVCLTDCKRKVDNNYLPSEIFTIYEKE